MGIEIQAIPEGVQPGDLATFTFQEQVMAYTLGMSGFELSYGRDDDHWVQSISIQMTSSQPSSNTVSVQVDARLQDAQGTTLNPEWSSIYPVCVAVTGTSQPKTVMTNIAAIANGSKAEVSLPGASGFSVLESFLYGFDLTFSDQQTQFLGAYAGCGITNNQSQGFVASSADLYDDSDNHVNTATVDAGVIASTFADPGYEIQEVRGAGPAIEVTFSSLPSISQAYCLIREWHIQYPGTSDHNLLWIGAGVIGTDTLEISGNTVTISNLSAGVMDRDGNHSADITKSYCTAFVIALP